MTEPIDPPEGEVEGPTEPIPGGQPTQPPQPVVPAPGTYFSRNAGRRQTILESFAKVVTQDKLDDAVDGVRDDVHNMGTVVQDYGTAIEELGKNRVMPWAVPTVAPLSQTINRRADPTFQLSDFMVPNSSVGLSGRTNRAGGDSHDHDLGSFATATNSWSIPRGANTKGRIYYAFITPAVTRAYTQLNFMVSEVVDPCRMDIAVYVVDPNRGLTRQVHQTDVLASLGFGESVVTATFPTFVAEQGSYLAIAFLQHGTGNSRYILGLDDTPRPLLGSIFPPKISATNQQTGLTALPAFIDGNNGNLVDFAGYWFTPYAELSEDVGIDYKMFTENWPDIGGPIGRPWVALTAQGIGSWGGYAAAGGFGYKVSMYDTPLATDFVRVRTTVRDPRPGQFARRSTLIFRSTNDLRSGIGLSVVGDERYEVISWTNRNADSSWDDRTVLATVNTSPAHGHVVEVDYLDGMVNVRIGGAQRVTGLAVGGAGGRFVGLQAERTGNVLLASPSPRFGPWSARDLPQEDGGDGDEGSGA